MYYRATRRRALVCRPVLTLLCVRRASYTPDPEHRRDTGELLKGSRFPDGGNPPSVVDALHKGGREVTHHFHPDQIAAMDPVLRHRLRVGCAKDGSEPPA